MHAGSLLFLLLFKEGKAKWGLQYCSLCQKQGTEEVIEFAAGALKSMANLQVMRRMEAHIHIWLCL